MKSRFFFLTVSLIAVLLTVSCAPAAVTESAAPVDSALATEAIVPVVEATPEVVALTESPAVQPVATSRGDNLEATDPSTVSLASGQLQLVEFFRFT